MTDTFSTHSLQADTWHQAKCLLLPFGRVFWFPGRAPDLEDGTDKSNHISETNLA